MTPEQQRIAIAEACGARWYNGKILTFHVPANMEQLGPEQTELADGAVLAPDIPDYLNDLNAMHEGEKVMSVEQKYKFVCHLRDSVSGPTMSEYGCTFSTAAQRAEAFLRTLNLWQTC